jgi:hypothetical protein
MTDDASEPSWLLLNSLRPLPDVRDRLHSICALYAYTNSAHDRLALLDHLEDIALQAAAQMAHELLEQG